MTLSIVFAVLLLGAPAHGTQASKDTAAYKQFEETAADLAPADKIQTWEAFLKKYPHSSHAPQVKKLLAELRSLQAPAHTAAPASAPVVAAAPAAPAPIATATPYDPDLSFLYDSPPAASATKSAPAPKAAAAPDDSLFAAPAASSAPASEPSIFDSPASAPAPKPAPARVAAVSTPAPRPAPAAEPSIFDAPAPAAKPAPVRVAAASTPTPAPRPAPTTEPSFFDAQPAPVRVATAAPAPAPRRRAARSAPVAMESSSTGGGFFSNTHTELSLFGAMSPDETLVQNSLTGGSLSERFGRFWALDLEGASASNHETTLLQTLRAANRPPVVITKFKYLAGAGVRFNALSAVDTTGRLSDKNDLFIVAGGGIVNTEVDICKTGCTSTLVVPSVNFEYATVGVGHRFYVTPWLAIGSEFRERVVFEVIDGAVHPRTNLQINVGPSVTF